MEFFDLFRKKEKKNQKAKERTMAYNIIPDDDFVLYENTWSRKAECGSQWVQLTFNGGRCEVIYNDVHFNKYANPRLETHNTKNAIIDSKTLVNSTYVEIISIVNRSLDLSLETAHCSPKDDFDRFVDMIKNIETGMLTDTINWQLKNGVLTIFGDGSLPISGAYLEVEAPTHEGYKVFYVLPWAVNKEIRLLGRIGESTLVQDIPNKTKVRKMVVSGNIQGLDRYLLCAYNPYDFNLQPVREYFSFNNDL